MMTKDCKDFFLEDFNEDMTAYINRLLSLRPVNQSPDRDLALCKLFHIASTYKHLHHSIQNYLNEIENDK